MGIDESLYDSLMVKKCKGLMWHCDSCPVENDDVDITKNNDFEQIATEIKKELKDYIKTEISSLIDLINGRVNQNDPSYPGGSELTNNTTANKIFEPAQSKKHVLLLKPNEETDSNFSETAWTSLQTTIKPKLKHIAVTKSTRTNDGKGVLIFPSSKLRDEAALTLEGTCSFQSQDKDTKFLYPKIKICGIPKESFQKLDKTLIKESILEKNHEINKLVTNDKQIFEILFWNDETDPDYCYAVAKVDEKIKKQIELQGQKLYIGLSSCRVYERYHLIQCYQCQGFGHKKGSSNCSLFKKEESICLYCAEKHTSKSCTNKKKSKKCYNCLNAKDSRVKENCNGHNTTSHTCPVLQQALKLTMNRTIGCEYRKDLPKNAICT